MKQFVVVDFTGPNSRENRAFDRKIVGGSRSSLPMCYLYEEAQKRGIELMTTDIYLASPKSFPNAILWRGINSEGDIAERVIRAGAQPVIFNGYENPLYDCDFYWRLGKYVAGYEVVLMPRGAATFAAGIAKLEQSVFPAPYPQSTRVTSNFRNKKFLMMINTNVRLHPLRRLYVAVANTLRPLPTLVNREIYVDRLEAISYFSKRSDFDLYGMGWDKPVRYTFGNKAARYREAIKKTWCGTVGDKVPLLQQYKFSLCFENCIFSGWITEKIFDSMLSGCVPIYWGEPDVARLIPPDCFIDFRNFKNYAELEQFLDAMDEATYQRYMDSINTFVASDQYYVFTQEKFAEDMIALFTEYSP